MPGDFLFDYSFARNEKLLIFVLGNFFNILELLTNDDI